MPIAEQIFQILRENLSDTELAQVSRNLGHLIAAHDRIVSTHVPNPQLSRQQKKEVTEPSVN